MALLGTASDAAIAQGATLEDSGVDRGPNVIAPMLGAVMGIPLTQPTPRGHADDDPLYFMSFEVHGNGNTSGAAMRQAAVLTRDLKQMLKAKLGDQGSVEVSELNVHEDFVAPAPGQSSQTWTAQNSIAITTGANQPLGEIVAAAFRAGATRLNSITFTLRDDTQARADAIAKASKQAQAKAESAARSMGVQLGRILNISSAGSVRPGTIGYAPRGIEPAMAAIQPKSASYDADVTVTYEIE